MIQFYEIYKENQKVRTLLAQLSWINNLLLIIQETKTFEDKEFYIHLWSNIPTDTKDKL